MILAFFGGPDAIQNSIQNKMNPKNAIGWLLTRLGSPLYADSRRSEIAI